jgi:hypothetical protein
VNILGSARRIEKNEEGFLVRKNVSECRQRERPRTSSKTFVGGKLENKFQNLAQNIYFEINFWRGKSSCLDRAHRFIKVQCCFYGG